MWGKIGDILFIKECYLINIEAVLESKNHFWNNNYSWKDHKWMTP